MRKTAMKEEIYHFNQKSDMKDLIRFSICGITFPDKNYRINRPNSRISCIEYIEEGTGTVHIGNKTFYPSEHDSYFLQSGKNHHYYSDRARPWKKYFINFSGKLTEALTEGYGLSDISHFEGLDIKNELLQIIEIGKNETEDSSMQIVEILNKIFFKMRNHAQKDKLHNTVEYEMKEFLNTQITKKFRVDLLARHISHSESQTIRMFKKAYGITPYAYVLTKKIDLAKKLLCDTNLSVKEISDKLCFSDEYYFSNMFKKRTGITPSSYKKNVMQGEYRI